MAPTVRAGRRARRGPGGAGREIRAAEASGSSDVADQLVGVLRPVHDVDVCLAEQPDDPLAGEHRVIGDDYAHRTPLGYGSRMRPPPTAPSRSSSATRDDVRSETVVLDGDAMANSLERHVAISTFAPDGSDFTEVIYRRLQPALVARRLQIVYAVPTRGPSDAGGAPLAMADADGSNVRVFDFGGVGPWHPRTLDPPSEDMLVNGLPDTNRNPAGTCTRGTGPAVRLQHRFLAQRIRIR